MKASGQFYAAATLLQRDRPFGTPWIGGWVGSTTCLKTETRSIAKPTLCRESSPCRPASHQSPVTSHQSLYSI